MIDVDRLAVFSRCTLVAVIGLEPDFHSVHKEESI
jgi:hypothetical protein